MLVGHVTGCSAGLVYSVWFLIPVISVLSYYAEGECKVHVCCSNEYVLIQIEGPTEKDIRES